MSTSVLLAGVEPAAAAPALEPPDVTCASCVVLEVGGDPLWHRDARVTRPIASTTKMMTALLVVRRARLEDEVVVSPAAASVGAGGLDLDAGERLSVEELLYALLLTSSNEAAVALAEHVSGSEDAFVVAMNELAPRLGAPGATFVTSHGLDQPGHAATALDLARLAEKVLSDPLLARVVATSGVWVETDRGEYFLENRNLLLESYAGAVGVKTGFTSEAGNVLVAAAEREGRTVVAVAMDSVDATADAAALLDYGFEALAGPIVLRGAIVADLILEPGVVTAVADAGVEGLADPDEVEVRFVPATRVELPVDAGERVGRIVLEHDGVVIGSTDAVALDDVQPSPASPLAGLLSLVLAGVGAVGSFALMRA